LARAGDSLLVNYLTVDPANGDLLPNDVSLTVLTVVPEPGSSTLLRRAAWLRVVPPSPPSSGIGYNRALGRLLNAQRHCQEVNCLKSVYRSVTSGGAVS
jgi:hypothetical protein